MCIAFLQAPPSVYFSLSGGWWALHRGALWTGYFERLHQADPPVVELDVRDVSIPIADPLINSGPHSFMGTPAAVNRLKWGKALGICGIHAELLKADGNAVSHIVAYSSVLCLEHKHHPN